MPAFVDPAAIRFRSPTAVDGPALTELIARCPPLDPNSRYCNLLQCSHFADTAVLAEDAGRLVGAVTGYRMPDRPNVLFVWQVAVDELARGCQLAQRMILDLLARRGQPPIDQLETTITPDNAASWRLFRRLAERLDAPLTEKLLFDRERHFAGHHDSEVLCHIGPFTPLSHRH